ncbi:MAG: LytTR family transcriptional regulator [Faecalibacterium sp.]|nr:LytTR family transcriptional regulator [Ruminococcus sp.]MCM1392413.1 LytTR family transcriptional regulator [Ruminococcus sp.]MCM1486401.1 LytTR family transcriptional regulator [Faecalibacterium sp.]
MKIKLAVNDDDYEKIKIELENHGIETDDKAELVLSKINNFSENLIVRDKITNEHIILPCEKIIYIESYGHLVDVHTADGVYQLSERLYKILQRLDNNLFLRISNSVIVSKKQIKRISPTFSMKFILTMSDSSRVDVTRSYYYAFKETFNI